MKNTIKTIYHLVQVEYVTCDACGCDKSKREFRPINLACSEYVCRECEVEYEVERLTQVNQD